MSTIKEIAKRANVSIGTVDRVIHKRGRVSSVTQEKVRRIIEETDYRPNIFAKHLRLAKPFTFGVMMPKPSQDGHYWALPAKGIARAQRELSSQKVRVRYFFYDKHSPSSFNKARQDVIRTSIDGLLIAPVLPKVFEPFLRELPPQMPYVFFDSFIPEAPYVSYIGQDAFQSGILAGRLMQMLVRDGGHVAILRVLPEDYHIDDRVNGFVSYCRRTWGVPADIYEIDTHRSAEARRRIFNHVFDNGTGLCGVFVTNASTHLAAAHVKARNLAGRVHVIGYDLVEENVRFLREGVIDFLISQQSERQGYEGIVSLYRHVVLQEPVEKTIMMQLDIVTRENIDYYPS